MVEGACFGSKNHHRFESCLPYHFCLYCGKELDLTNRDKRSKFCNSSCAAKYNNSKRKHSEETKQKISKALTKNNNGHVAKWVDALRSNRSEFNTHESSNLSMATDKMIGSDE